MENLIGKENGLNYLDAYLHNTPRTFNRAATKLDIAGLNKSRYTDGIALLRQLKKDAEEREASFYNLFDDVKTAEQWSDKYLARSIGEPYQQVLAVWNSHDMRKKIQGLLSDQEILNKLTRILSSKEVQQITDAVHLTGTFQSILEDAKNELTLSVKDILSKLVISSTAHLADKDRKNLQHAIRKAIGQDIKKKKILTSKNSSELKDLENRIIFEKTDKIERANDAYEFFIKQLEESSGQKNVLNNNDYKKYIEAIKETLFEAAEGKNLLFAKNASISIGEVQELGDGIILSLALDMGFEKTKNPRASEKAVNTILSTGELKVSRFGKRVSSKIDMWMNFPGAEQYKFQQKNTDKDLFLQYEKLGQDFSFSQENVFFNVGSEIKYSSFIQQLQEISTQNWGIADGDTLGRLTYLLVNLNVLNLAKGKDKLYKQDTENRSGLLLTKVDDTISKIIGQSALLLFSDFEKDITNAGLYQKNTYDFIIFNSRFLIPLSYVYDAIIKSLENYSIKLNKDIAHLTVRSAISDFSSSRIDQMAEDKKEAIKPENFVKNGDYSNPNLVRVGRQYGLQAANNLVLKGFQLDFNIKSILSAENLVKHFILR